MSIIDNNSEYEDEDREMLERLEKEITTEVFGRVNAAFNPGHDDGVLKDGVFQYGELPVAMWVDSDREKVSAWLAKFGIDMANAALIKVHRPTMTVLLYHVDGEGRKHLEGHCNGETTELNIRATNPVYTPDSLTVICKGCGMNLGDVSRSVKLSDYSKVLRDHSICMAEPVEVVIGD